MRNYIFKLILTTIVLVMFNQTKAQISGTVFRDFNGNGAKNNNATFNEPFVAGVLVKAFNAANVQLGTTKTTDAAGAYSFTVAEIPATTRVRIEFSGLAVGDANTFNGTGNGTNVQFATAGATVNYAINASDDYWNNVIEANPVLVAAQNHRGRNDGYYAGNVSLVQLNNNSLSVSPPTSAGQVSIDTGQTVAARRAATYAQTGSTFGLAVQQKSQRIFQTAVLKRGHGFGPQGPGGIYFSTKGATYLSYSGSFTLQGVTPSNGGGALDFGTVTRRLAVNPAVPTAAELADNNYLSSTWAFSINTTGPNNAGGDSRDNDAFAKVGTMSYGDIEADKATDKLYTINLFQRKLIVLDIENSTNATLNNATAATLSPLVRAYDLTTLPGWPTPTGAGNILRPYGVKIYKGVGYIGVVSDGSSTLLKADVDGYVLKFNPNNIAAGFTTVLTIDFNQYGPLFGFQNFYMSPWVSTWAQAITLTGAGAPGPAYIAQPMIAGFEFNEDGSMDIAIRDRWGDQGSGFEYTAIANSTKHVQTVTMGDLLHCTKSGTTWVIENTTTQPAANTNASGSATNSFGDGSSFGSTGKEFYADRSGDSQPEGNEAGITKLMGTQIIVTTTYDPIAQGATTGNLYWSTQGITWNSTVTGNKTQWARTIGNASADKSNGMGDLEFLTMPSPIQIGNRIWLDANGNGIQDADETTAGVPTGTTVTLRSPGVDGIYGTADDQTTTTTTDANGNYYFSTLAAADNRKPSLWAGIGSSILPGYSYKIEVATPAGFILTKANVASNLVDNIDNDATVNGLNAEVLFTTDNINHNFDIGFKQLASISDKVWLDEGAGGGIAKDGIQNGAEPGIAGVTVALYQNGVDGVSGTTDDVLLGTTVTDAYGIYLFDNLIPSTNTTTSYNISFTLPANHQFTTQTNTQVTGTSNATNTTTVSGGATTANGSDVNVITGRTGSFWLTQAEVELGADAGIVFTVPTLPNSIGDKVWLDLDGNGTQNGTEPGIAGVVVQLLNDVTGAVLTTTITDANGNYIFNDLPASTNYKVKVSTPASMVFTSSVATTTANNTINSDVTAVINAINYGISATINTGIAGTNITGIDAGLIPQANNTASLGDRIWNDLNNNGTQEAGEPGIAGVTVNLYEDVNGDQILNVAEMIPVRTTITDVFGNYMFNNLTLTAINRWQLEFVQPIGFNNTAVLDNNSTNDATDSDIIDNATDRTTFIRLKFNERNSSYDAGFVQIAPAGNIKLGDKVWRDNDNDGVQDANEPGVVGVTVKLYQNGTDGLPGTVDDVLLTTTSTDINGSYLFANLAASTNAATNYNVQFSNLPIGFIFTVQNVGSIITDNNVNVLGKTGSINLTTTDITIDAGIKQGTPSGLASLGNKVWYDLNNNGTQDATEFGAQGVIVNLFRDANNDGTISATELTAVATTITNSLGEYMFNNLQTGTYQVGFTLPTALSTYTLTIKDAATATDAADSDGNPKNSSVAGNTAGAQTSYTALIPLSQGEDNITIDLGIVPPANTNTLGNLVWFDLNSNGIQDADEAGVPGVIVTLLNNIGTVIATTTTDKSGNYLFVGLADGNYIVSFKNYPQGFEPTVKSVTNDLVGSDADIVNGNTIAVTLNFATGGTSRDNRSLDAGIISTRAALGNKVWDDLNGDGIQDASEPGVAGVQVILYASNGSTIITSTITDQHGYYLFSNLTAADYIVGINAATLPFAKQITTQFNLSAPPDNLVNFWTAGGDSDVDPITGLTPLITITPNEVNLTVDAGIRSLPIATVGDRVWDDLDKDGMQDVGEPGIAGVIATLYNSANQPISSAISDGNGNWLITNVAPGVGYYVIFSNKPAGSFTLQDQGVNGAGTGGTTESDFDSDVNISGQTNLFNVTANDLKIVIDAGITQVATLPVKYITFTATKQYNQSLLHFVIAQAAPTSTFVIERSTNGANYIAIGSLQGTNATTYNYVDNLPLLSEKNYYRIKEIEANGEISYSLIRWVKFSKTNEVELYPIPATTVLNINVGSELANKQLLIRLYNTQGQQVMQKQISRANIIETIQVNNYASGSYKLIITSNNETIVNKTILITK